jgi:geranylgeranyl diphosphate synthase, type II
MARKKVALDFEQSLADLQTLVERLENGELSLEDSLTAFEQGIGLTRDCQSALAQAEQKVQVLLERDGELAEEPFDAEQSAMIDVYQISSQARVNAALEPLVCGAKPGVGRLYEAMRYSVMNGGKRVRPLLAYAACEALGADAAQANGAACAVELIHAYSLVHDDLPAMDDDDLRRGQPTTHKAFDEACAILAGDGLQSLAFSALLDPRLSGVNAEIRLRMVTALAAAAGPAGMVGGQAIDLGSVGLKLDQQALEYMHRHKTGALIEAAVHLGALASGRAKRRSWPLCRSMPGPSAWHFQVQDDILDVESDTATLGKRQGADIARDKPTYPRC